jgi:hypothetical protein
VCSDQWEGSSFYRSGRWLWGGARVAGVVVGPGLRRGKGWARTIAGVLARLTRVMAVKTRVYSGGELDGSAQVMAVGRGCARHLWRSRGQVTVSRSVRVVSRVDWR